MGLDFGFPPNEQKTVGYWTRRDGDAPLDVVPEEADRRLQLLNLCVFWWVQVTL